jgi:hypothetical protein
MHPRVREILCRVVTFISNSFISMMMLEMLTFCVRLPIYPGSIICQYFPFHELSKILSWNHSIASVNPVLSSYRYPLLATCSRYLYRPTPHD